VAFRRVEGIANDESIGWCSDSLGDRECHVNERGWTGVLSGLRSSFVVASQQDATAFSRTRQHTAQRSVRYSPSSCLTTLLGAPSLDPRFPLPASEGYDSVQQLKELRNTSSSRWSWDR
jgi:hypothetical protein